MGKKLPSARPKAVNGAFKVPRGKSERAERHNTHVGRWEEFCAPIVRLSRNLVDDPEDAL